MPAKLNTSPICVAKSDRAWSLPSITRVCAPGQASSWGAKASGERYRDSLRQRAASLGVGDMVEFDASYRDVSSLNRLVRVADVVLLPYETREQVTSGVLIEAVASERPVVATDFPHARELLTGGAGIVVPPDARSSEWHEQRTERAARMRANSCRFHSA